MDFNSDLMASSHNSEFGSTIASAYVKGSSLSNNNTLLALRNLSDLRGVGKRSRKQKKSCLRIKIPRSSKKDRIQGLGHSSPTVAAEEELVKRVDVVEVVEVDLPRTVPRSIQRTSPSNISLRR